MNCLIDLSQLTNYRLRDGITAILKKVEVRALELERGKLELSVLAGRGRPAGPSP